MSAAGAERDGEPLDPELERMRELGHRVVDRVVERWANLRDRPANRPGSREEMEERLREPVPEEGGDPGEALAAFWEDVEPFAGATNHARFMAFIPSSPSFGSLLGSWVTAGCNFFQGTWIESPGPSQVELVALDWIKEAVGYPGEARGLLTSGGSAANLMGLAAARNATLGTEPGRGVAYTSDQAHSAVDRAFRILGVPEERVRRLPTDDAYRLDPAAVEEAVRRDREQGLRPFCVVASAGTTNTGAVDPLDEVADLCRRRELWMHVDGAYGAAAAVTDRGRERLSGMERADSLVLDPHKWMYVGYETGCLLVRDGDALYDAFHVLPDYLKDVEAERGEVNFADYGVQLTREARAIRVWMSLKTHGLDAVRREIRRTCRLAEGAEEEVRGRPELELMSRASMGVVCFRHAGPDVPGNGDAGAERAADSAEPAAGAEPADPADPADPSDSAEPADPRGPAGEPLAARARDDHRIDVLNDRIVKRIQEEGTFMLSSTRLHGRYVIRLCPLNHRTTAADVVDLLDEVVRIGGELSRSATE